MRGMVAAVRGISVAPTRTGRAHRFAHNAHGQGAILVMDGRWTEVTPNRPRVAGVRRCCRTGCAPIRNPTALFFPAIMELWLEQIGPHLANRQPQLQDRGGI